MLGKRGLLFILISVVCLPFAHGQDTSFLECYYTKKARLRLDRKRLSPDEMTLRIGHNTTAFFSRWYAERQAISDSLLRKGASVSEVLDAEEKSGYPMSIFASVIYKNIPSDGQWTETDKIANRDYQYTEDIQAPEWEITDEKMEILRYDCQKAVTDYYGRKWTVWFTTEIPIQAGPWKLHGLPGLILQAVDESKDYSFQCIELNNIDGVIEIPKKRYVKCSKEEYVSLLNAFESNDTKFRRSHGMAYAWPIDKGPDYTPDDIPFNYIERSSEAE